jgi:hypothetical protein
MKLQKKAKMGKKRIMKVCLSAVILLILGSGSLFACTGFAVYSDRIFYGMNFDYDPSRELKFCVNTIGDSKVFFMQLEWERDYFVPIVAMNTKGFFGNVQMVFPEVPRRVSSGPGDIGITELLDAATTLGSCQDVIDILNGHEVVMGTVSLHSLYADAYGDAMVVEVGPDDTTITRIDGDFIVMTNFPLFQFAGEPFDTVYGAGGDRYKTAYRYLMKNAKTFELEDGFTLLKSVVNYSTNAPTRCSMIFDPGSNEVYIALEGNFDKVWGISLENETVETFRGFDEHITMDIGEGVLASELELLESESALEPEIEFEPEAIPESIVPLRSVVLGLILVGAILVIGYKVKSRTR